METQPAPDTSSDPQVKHTYDSNRKPSSYARNISSFTSSTNGKSKSDNVSMPQKSSVPKSTAQPANSSKQDPASVLRNMMKAAAEHDEEERSKWSGRFKMRNVKIYICQLNFYHMAISITGIMIIYVIIYLY